MGHAYSQPGTVREALELLSRGSDNIQIIAGGTDLMVLYHEQPEKKGDIVDVCGIKELQGIYEENDHIYIGGAVTHSEAMHSSLIVKYAKVLAEACGQVGSIQIRNIATIVGNVVTALPAADAAVALFALDAECEIYESAEKVVWKPMAAMYAGVGQSTLAKHHIVSRIRFKTHPHQTTAYQRMATRKALSLPVLCTAVALTIVDNSIEAAKVVVAPAGPMPLRARATENYLLGKKPTREVFKEAAQLCVEGAQIRTSAVRGGKEYREKVLPVFVQRALCQAANVTN